MIMILQGIIEYGQPKFINGYEFAGTQLTNGLDAMVTDLAAAMPFAPVHTEPLNTALVSYIQSLYFSSPSLDQQQQLQAMMGNIFNAYVGPGNPVEEYYSAEQLFKIDQIISAFKNMAIGSYSSLINTYSLLSENIAISKLTTEEQSVLLLALALAFITNNYFLTQISSPSTEWANFLNADSAVNYINLRRWVTVSFIGALIGATQSVPVVPTNAAQGTGVGRNFVTTLAGALTLIFGEIVFGWVQKTSINCECN